MPRNQFEYWLMLVGAIVVLFLGLQGLFTGRVYFRNSQVEENKGWVLRSEMPGSFWIGVFIYLFSGGLALICLFAWS